MVADANLACMQSKKALFSRYRERKFGVFRLGSVSINRAFSAGSKQTLSRGGRGRKTRRDQEEKKNGCVFTARNKNAGRSSEDLPYFYDRPININTRPNAHPSA